MKLKALGILTSLVALLTINISKVSAYDQIDVALIDTGASLSENVIERISVIDEDPEDYSGHGNAMVDAIVSEAPNAKILSIKALDNGGIGNVDNIIEAMKIAISRNVKIINLSISATNTSNTSRLTSYVNEAVKKGIIVVGSAGNQGLNVQNFVPASISSALIVGASDESGRELDSSNYGETVDITRVASSTSQAAALTTGWIVANADYSNYREKLANEIGNGEFFAAVRTGESADPDWNSEMFTTQYKVIISCYKDGVYSHNHTATFEDGEDWSVTSFKGDSQHSGYSFQGGETSGTSSAFSDVSVRWDWKYNAQIQITYDYNGAKDHSNYSYTYSAGEYSIIFEQDLTHDNTVDNSTVSFNANGGTVNPTSKSITRTRTYTQNGWKDLSTGTMYKTATSAILTSSTTYQVQWTVNLGSYTSVTLPTPVRSGYTFKGWYNSSSVKVGDAGDSYKPHGDETLVAMWENTVQYTITYKNQKGDVITTQKYDKGQVTLLSTIPSGQISHVDSTGTVLFKFEDGKTADVSKAVTSTTTYQFTGWEDVNGSAYQPGGTYNLTENTTMYATGAPTGTTSTSVDVPSAPTRSGYDFQGWATSSSASTPNVTITNGKYIPTAASGATLYAVWKEKNGGGGYIPPTPTPPTPTTTYTVTYNANGGAGSMSSSTATANQPFITKSNAFTRTGYKFKGWNEKADGTGVVWDSSKTGTYENGTPWTWTYTNNITLYAQWEEIPEGQDKTYVVHYNANGGSGTMSDSTATYGKDFKTKKNVFTRTGYEFSKWNEKADGTGISWDLDEPGTEESGAASKWEYEHDITLYAQWVSKTYTVKYDANGGTGTMANDTAKYNEKFMTTANKFHRDGYRFAGWYEKTSNEDVEWKNGTAESGKYWVWKYDHDVTLYAKWEKADGKVKYNVFYDANGGKGTMEPSVAIYGEYFITAKNSFTREGYKFVGWNEREDGKGTSWSLRSNGTYESNTKWKWIYDHDITLFAQWEKSDGNGASADDKTPENPKTAVVSILVPVVLVVSGVLAALKITKKKNMFKQI